MKKAETQQAILLAAKELFIANGYRGTTTLQIAREANISEMTLFRHFPSKEEIFLAVIRPVLSFMDQLNIEGENDIRQAVKDLLENRLRFMMEERDLIRLVVMESFLTERSENPVTMVMARVEEVFSAYAPEERKLMLRVLAGFILSGIYLPEYENDPSVLERFLQDVMYPLLDGYEQ